MGDVNVAQVKAMAAEYFGRLVKRPLPPPVTTVEPPQEGPKRIDIASPGAAHRSARLPSSGPIRQRRSGLRRDFERALGRAGPASCIATWCATSVWRLRPARKLSCRAASIPGLFLFYLIPGLGHTAAENEKELDTILADFEKTKVDDATLARVKTRTRAGLIRRLDNNAGLAQLLAEYYANYGDWRKLFTSIDDIDKVTADDVQRVAKQYFTPANRTIGTTYQPAAATAAEAKSGEAK